MDIVTRKQINILIQLAKADNELAASEKKMIYRIAEEKGFPKHEVTNLMKNTEPVGSLGALSEDQKFEYLFNAIALMKVDKKISSSELLFCQDIAIRMGFQKDVVNMMAREIDEINGVSKSTLKEKALGYSFV